MAVFYIALSIIRPYDELFPELGTIHFERIYAICMIAAVFLGRGNKLRIKMSFQTVAVVLLLLAIGVSTLFAWKTSFALNPFYVYLTLVIFYFVLIVVARSPYELVFVVACYILAMATCLAKCQWEYFVHDRHLSSMGVRRMIGITDLHGGPNGLAMSIVVSLPMWWFLYSVRDRFTRGWPNLWRKWFSRSLVIYFALALTSIMLTNSRSGMLSFVLFVLLMALRGQGGMRKLKRVMAGVMILLAIWSVLPQEQKNRFRTIWDPTAGPPSATSSAYGRIEGFKAGITMFKRFPLTGVGVGNFIPYRRAHVDGVGLDPHNMVGQVLGETGVVGSMIFVLVVASIFANCRKVRVLASGRSNPTLDVLSGLAVACRDAVILLAFEGLFGHNVRRFNWLWLAAFGYLALEYTKQHIRQTISQSKASEKKREALHQC